MNAISELVSEYNNADMSTANPQEVKITALLVTSMANILAWMVQLLQKDLKLAGLESVSQNLPSHDYSLSTMRDSLCKAARAKDGLLLDQLRCIVGPGVVTETKPSDLAKPYADLLSNFRAELSSRETSSNIFQEIMTLCDRVRDIGHLDLCIYLEGRETQSALVRPASNELFQAREEKAEKLDESNWRRRRKERDSLRKAEKWKLSLCRVRKQIKVQENFITVILKETKKKTPKKIMSEKRILEIFEGNDMKNNTLEQQTNPSTTLNESPVAYSKNWPKYRFLIHALINQIRLSSFQQYIDLRKNRRARSKH